MADKERDDKTVLAMRLPKELKDRIGEAAKREHRTASSFARYYLEQAAEQTEKTQPAHAQ